MALHCVMAATILTQGLDLLADFRALPTLPRAIYSCPDAGSATLPILLPSRPALPLLVAVRLLLLLANGGGALRLPLPGV